MQATGTMASRVEQGLGTIRSTIAATELTTRFAAAELAMLDLNQPNGRNRVQIWELIEAEIGLTDFHVEVLKNKLKFAKKSKHLIFLTHSTWGTAPPSSHRGRTTRK